MSRPSDDRIATLTTPLITATVALLSNAAPAAAQSADTSEQGDFMLLVIVVIAFVIYAIPSIVAFWRRHPNRWPILLINVFLGGTGLGWFGALIWACGAVHKSPTGNNGGESGLNLFANDPVNVRLDAANLDVTVARDPVDQLHRLKTLLDAGAVSTEEYAALRKPLLDQVMK